MQIYEEFQKTADAYPNRVHVVEMGPSGEKSYTFGQILRETEILRSFLASLSFPKGTRIGLLSENRHEWITTYFATVSLGLTSVHLDPLLSPSEWLPLLHRSRARILFLSSRLSVSQEDMRREAPSVERVIYFDDLSSQEREGLSYSRIMAEAKNRPSQNFPQAGERDIASMIFTSGTTGTSKGVLLSHTNVLASAKGFASLQCPGKENRRVTIIPLHHSYGLSLWLAGVFHKAAFAFYPLLKPEILFASFKKLRPHTLFGVPALFQQMGMKIESRLPVLLRPLIQSLARSWLGDQGLHARFLKRIIFRKVHREFGSSMEAFISGGAPLDPYWIRLFNLLGISVYEGYGITENSPGISCNDVGAYRVGSVGKALVGLEVRIALDPESSPVGEICVRGPSVMQGYDGNPEATEEMVDHEGWLYTGDLGTLDQDGFIFIVGRKKDVVVTANGKNIYPAELAQYFEKIDFIKEACVFGLNTNSSRDEIVHLQVVPDFERAKNEGISDVISLLKARIREASDRLTEYKRPKSVGFSLEPFPRSGSLKIKKFEVKKSFLESSRQENQNLPQMSGDPLLKSPTGEKLCHLLKSFSLKQNRILSSDSLVFDLGMDSLTIMEFWLAVENAFGLRIPEKVRPLLKEIGPICNYLEKEAVGLSQRAASPCPEREWDTDRWDSILEARPTEEVIETAADVLASYPRVRPVFLKLFRKFFQKTSHLTVEGLENLPPSGPFILAPNHECHLDNLFVASLLPVEFQKKMAVLGKKEHFEHLITRSIARLCHAVPVDRGEVSPQVLQTCAEILRQGRILLVHPEGTRSLDGKLLPFKDGAALLSLYLGCPIVPVYIEGTYEFWPRRSWRPLRLGKISVFIGKLLKPADLGSTSKDSSLKTARQLTVRLETSIREMERDYGKK